MNRRITKKKRILRVKTRGCVRSRGRGHGRGRGRVGNYTMRGGLGPHDGVNISITDRFSFTDPSHVIEFGMFVFGTPLQIQAWTRLLEKCQDKNVPVYILTAGNKVGIIRTLQLLNMDNYFREVLCTNRSDVSNRMSVLSNPRNVTGEHNFHGRSKYDVIYEITNELLRTDPLPSSKIINGCLLDDDESNRVDSSLVPNVEFLHTKTSARPSDFDEAELKANVFYNLRMQKMRNNPNMNFTPIDLINSVYSKVDNDTYKVVFIDFDETFELWDSAMPLQNIKRLDQFRDIQREITVA